MCRRSERDSGDKDKPDMNFTWNLSLAADPPHAFLGDKPETDPGGLVIIVGPS